MTATINATVTVWAEHMRKLLMSGEELFGTMIQPVLRVALFGLGMTGLVGLDGTYDSGTYIGFMLPGIVAPSAMGGAIGGGMTRLAERLRGTLKGHLVAPVPRASIVLGTVQGIVIVLVGAPIGTGPRGGPRVAPARVVRDWVAFRTACGLSYRRGGLVGAFSVVRWNRKGDRSVWYRRQGHASTNQAHSVSPTPSASSVKMTRLRRGHSLIAFVTD